jgi:hypothetical protein
MSLGLVTLGESMVLLIAGHAGPLREAATFRRHVAGSSPTTDIRR